MAKALERFITELEPEKSASGAVVSLGKSMLALTRNVDSLDVIQYAELLRNID